MWEYAALPMGLSVSTDEFQATMSGLFEDMPEVVVYIDEIIIINTGSYEEQLETIETVIERLIEMDMQINPRKTTWAADKVDYLGITIIRDDIKPKGTSHPKN